MKALYSELFVHKAETIKMLNPLPIFNINKPSNPKVFNK